MTLLRLRSCSSRGRTRYPKRRERGNRGCPRLSPLRTSDAPTLAFPTRAARGSVGDRGDRGRGRDRCVACRSPTCAPASRASPTRRLRATWRSSPIPPCLSERACEIAQERARRSLAHSRGSSRGGYAANVDAANVTIGSSPYPRVRLFWRDVGMPVFAGDSGDGAPWRRGFLPTYGWRGNDEEGGAVLRPRRMR
jgi:hypothetical protein